MGWQCTNISVVSGGMDSGGLDYHPIKIIWTWCEKIWTEILLISKLGSRVLHISSKSKITTTANNLNMNPEYIAEGKHLGRGKSRSTVCLLISTYLMP